MAKESIGKYVAAIHRNAQSIIGCKLGEIDINNGQYDFFFVISKNEGISQKELSEHLYIGKSTTAKAVKQLIKNDYIYREQDEKDRRYFRLYLTEKGKKIAPLVNTTFLELIEIYSKNFTPQEYEEAIKILNKILGNLRDGKSKYCTDME